MFNDLFDSEYTRAQGTTRLLSPGQHIPNACDTRRTMPRRQQAITLGVGPNLATINLRVHLRRSSSRLAHRQNWQPRHQDQPLSKNPSPYHFHRESAPQRSVVRQLPQIQQ